MRSSAGLTWIALVLATGTSANMVNETALTDLPQCVRTCLAKVLPMFSCTPAESCFCENAQVEISSTSCLMDSRCSFEDQLLATKFKAETCGQRVRNRGPLLSAVTYTLFAVATVFTIARALSRSPKLVGVGFGSDDCTAFVSYILLIAMTAGDWFAIHYGQGRYIYTLSVDAASLFLMWFYISNTLYSVAIFLTKISLVLLYLRTWSKPKGGSSRFHTACLVSLVGLSTTMIAFTIVCIAQCQPISYIWTFVKGGTGTCIDRTAWLWGLSSADIGWNLIVILLPISQLLMLKVSGHKKLGICLVFLVGLVVIVCSFVRLKYISGFTTHKNFTYFYSYVGLWSSIEVYLSQVCCCMPASIGLARQASTYLHHIRHHESRPESPLGATVVSGTQFEIFDPPSTSGATDDVEKYSTSQSSSANRSKSQDSAPSPVVPLQPGQRSPPTPSPPPKHPSRAFVTTHHDVSGSRDVPDILYHDHFNDVRLEVIDPPESPIRAQLRYIDRNMVPHDVELQGDYRRPPTPRPSASRPPSRRAMRYSPRTMSPDLVPFAKAKPSWDTLRE